MLFINNFYQILIDTNLIWGKNRGRSDCPNEQQRFGFAPALLKISKPCKIIKIFVRRQGMVQEMDVNGILALVPAWSVCGELWPQY